MLATGKKKRARSSPPSDENKQRGRLVHEATRLVFCIYSGIEVDAIRREKLDIHVDYKTEQALDDPSRAEELFQMILSGGIGERRLVGTDSSDVDTDLEEIQQMYNLVFPDRAGIPSEFDTLIGRCRRRVLFHLADPKIRQAVHFAADQLGGIQDDIRGFHLDRLLNQVRQKLVGVES